MSTWTTRPGRPGLHELACSSPGLLFHKWQAYDLARDHQGNVRPNELTDKRTDARIDHLLAVQEAVHRVFREPAAYRLWYERYLASLAQLPGELVTLEATTLWRLVAGMATNPANETGLSLHPLLGIPLLPGSAVKGLVHHVAEAELAEKLGYREPDDPGQSHGPPSPPETGAALDEATAQAAVVRALFGSLAVERAGKGSDRRGRWTARAILEKWVHDHDRKTWELPPEQADRLRRVLRPTGGAARFYDAVPVPDQQGDLVQLDVMTPHYPDYYKDPQRHPPSDDQDPNPVPFLAVAPGVRFSFPIRVIGPEGELLRNLGIDLSPKESGRRLSRWLARGLALHGAGAKTAAGYGYFEAEGGGEVLESTR